MTKRLAAWLMLPAPTPVFPKWVEPTAETPVGKGGWSPWFWSTVTAISIFLTAEDMDGVLARAKDVGVAKMVTISTRVKRF